MTSLLLLTALTLTPSVESVSDYFPLVPGTKWHYSESSRGGDVSFVDEVGKPVDLEGGSATPILTKMSGRLVDTRYYRVEGDTVWWVAYGEKKMLPQPQPIFKLGSGKTKWTFDGETMFVNEPAPFRNESESNRKGRRKVLDVEREVVEVRQKGLLGGDRGTQVRGSQVAMYAKGVGLVELQSEQSMGGNTSKSLLRLVKFEPVTP